MSLEAPLRARVVPPPSLKSIGEVEVQMETSQNEKKDIQIRAAHPPTNHPPTLHAQYSALASLVSPPPP